MKSITIKALNDRGKDAINKHLVERAQLSRFNPQKIMYKQLFEEKIISNYPYVLEIRIKNPALTKALKFKDLKSQIEDALLKNKAQPKDYIIKEGL